MSLINSTRDIVRVGLKEGTRYRAIVLRNDDPKQLGRIKFKIPKFFEFDEVDAPWAISQSNDSDGAGKTFGTLNIPRKDSWVDIMFKGGSVYHPVYCPTSIFKSVQMTESAINYPDRKIQKLSNGCYLVIDEKDGFIDIFNPGDLRITTNGSTNLVVKGLCNFYVDGDVKFTSTKGNVVATALKGNVRVEATEGTTEVIAQNDVTVTSKTGKVNLIGPSGSGDLAGVVTNASICALTGLPHADCSNEIFATSGGK